MTKLILSIRDYLIVCFGAFGAIPSASLYLCQWIKTEYPALTGEQVLIIAAYLIRSAVVMPQVNPDQKIYLDKAVISILLDRQ